MCEHLEDEDPQPRSILISEANITLEMKSIQDLLEWTDTISDFLEDEDSTVTHKRGLTFTAQRLWPQSDNADSPTVVMAEYDWEFENNVDAAVRVVASSRFTMAELDDCDTFDRIGVNRSQVENLMLRDMRADVASAVTAEST